MRKVLFLCYFVLLILSTPLQFRRNRSRISSQQPAAVEGMELFSRAQELAAVV
mgnify:CR=1 FL=1